MNTKEKKAALEDAARMFSTLNLAMTVIAESLSEVNTPKAEDDTPKAEDNTPEAEDNTPEAEDNTPEAEAPPKRKRRTKKAAAKPEKSSQSKGGISEEDMMKGLRAGLSKCKTSMGDKEGRAWMVSCLDSFGAAKSTDLKPEHYQAFLDKVQAHVDAGCVETEDEDDI